MKIEVSIKGVLPRIILCFSLILVALKDVDAECDESIPSFSRVQETDDIHPHFYMRSRTIFCSLKKNNEHYLTKLLSKGDKGAANGYLNAQQLSSNIIQKVGSDDFGIDSTAFITFTKALTDSLADLSADAFQHCDTDQSEKISYDEYIKCLGKRNIQYYEDDVKKTYAEMKADSEEPLDDSQIEKNIKKYLGREDFVDLEMSLNHV